MSRALARDMPQQLQRPRKGKRLRAIETIENALKAEVGIKDVSCDGMGK